MGRVRQHFRWVVLCLAGGEGKKRDTGAANLLFVVFLMTEGPRRPKLQPGPEEGMLRKDAGGGVLGGGMGTWARHPPNRMPLYGDRRVTVRLLHPKS